MIADALHRCRSPRHPACRERTHFLNQSRPKHGLYPRIDTPVETLSLHIQHKVGERIGGLPLSRLCIVAGNPLAAAEEIFEGAEHSLLIVRMNLRRGVRIDC